VRSTQPILELNQTLVLEVGSAKINLLKTRSFAFLYQFPEQERHCAKMMKSLIRATIFVDHRFTVNKRKDRSNGPAIFSSHSDFYVRSHAGNKILKPCARLWQELVTPAGDHE
jgi:hypothetical protein